MLRLAWRGGGGGQGRAALRQLLTVRLPPLYKSHQCSAVLSSLEGLCT